MAMCCPIRLLHKRDNAEDHGRPLLWIPPLHCCQQGCHTKNPCQEGASPQHTLLGHTAGGAPQVWVHGHPHTFHMQISNCFVSIDKNLVGNFNFWFWFLGPPLEAEFWFCYWFQKFCSDFFWHSNVWTVRKLKFRFAKFGILVICLRRNSLCLIIANLYWHQSMYNNSILMVHKLAAPLQHQTADLGGTT